MTPPRAPCQPAQTNPTVVQSAIQTVPYIKHMFVEETKAMNFTIIMSPSTYLLSRTAVGSAV